MKIQQLPHEILEIIFKSVSSLSESRRSVLNCALVCQWWYSPACRILYERAKITDISRLLRCLVNQKENRGTYCKELDIMKNYCPEEKPSEIYAQLFSYLPNVETIRLQYCLLRTYHLQQITKHANLLKHVKEISTITYPWFSDELQCFFDCISAFKNNLQHMRLLASRTTVFSNNNKSGTILSFIHDFASLTSLDISNKKSSSLSNRPPLCMFSVLRSCPNLVRFCLDNDFGEPEGESSNNRFDHSKLRYMHITLPAITKSQINYMMSNITQLKQLTVKAGFRLLGTLDPPKPVQWLEEIGPECSNHFQKYLSRIEKLHFSTGEDLKMNISDYWSFGNGVISNSRSTPTHISLMLVALYNRPFVRKTALEKHPDSLFIHYGVDTKELTSVDKKFILPNFQEIFLAPLQLSEDNIRSFHVEIFARSREEKMVYARRFNILESILKGFSSVCYVELKVTHSGESSYQVKVGSNEIRNNSQRYHPIRSPIVLPRHSSISSNTLAYVTLTNVKSLNEVESIIKKLPCTKYLKILDCELNQGENSDFTLDLNSLSQLQRLELDISGIAYKTPGKQTIVLRIEQGKSNYSLYYKWEGESNGYARMKFEAVKASFSTKFERSSTSRVLNFLTKYERFSSPRPAIISIKCYKVGEIKLRAGEFSNTISSLGTF